LPTAVDAASSVYKYPYPACLCLFAHHTSSKLNPLLRPLSEPPTPRLYTLAHLSIRSTKQSSWPVSSLSLPRNRSDDTDEQQDKDDHHGRNPSYEGRPYSPQAQSTQVSPRTQSPQGHSTQGQSPTTDMPTAQSNFEQSTPRGPPSAPLSECMVRAMFSGLSDSSNR
jgi:hypothetical protein